MNACLLYTYVCVCVPYKEILEMKIVQRSNESYYRIRPARGAEMCEKCLTIKRNYSANVALFDFESQEMSCANVGYSNQRILGTHDQPLSFPIRIDIRLGGPRNVSHVNYRELERSNRELCECPSGSPSLQWTTAICHAMHHIVYIASRIVIQSIGGVETSPPVVSQLVFIAFSLASHDFHMI